MAQLQTYQLVFRTNATRAGKLLVGAATSGAVKSLVSSFGDKVVVEEMLVKIEDLDPSYWVYWLATSGYTSQAGEQRMSRRQGLLIAGRVARTASGMFLAGAMMGCRDSWTCGASLEATDQPGRVCH